MAIGLSRGARGLAGSADRLGQGEEEREACALMQRGPGGPIGLGRERERELGQRKREAGSGLSW
jgi:hypothetical protein